MVFNSVKVPMWNFSLHISQRILHTYRTYGKFYFDLFSLFSTKIEVHSEFFSSKIRKIFLLIEFSPKAFVYLYRVIILGTIFFKRLRKTHRKVNRSRSPPTISLTITGN